MTDPSFFNSVLIWPIINVLVLIYQAISFLNIPYTLGFAIIGLTIVIRLILYPLTTAQLKASKKMQDVAPHISKMKDRYKGDSKRIQEETMRLYKEHGVNPAAGCLPVILQIPVIWGLYSVLNSIVKLKDKDIVSSVNSVVYSSSLNLKEAWDPTFFGLPLGQSPSQLMSEMGPIVLLVPILTGVFQFVQSKMMFATPDKNQKKKQDFASAFQSQATYIFPIMIGFFSFTFPIGLSLYWNTFTIFGIIQQYKVQGLGGLEGAINSIKNNNYGRKEK